MPPKTFISTLVDNSAALDTCVIVSASLDGSTLALLPIKSWTLPNLSCNSAVEYPLLSASILFHN